MVEPPCCGRPIQRTSKALTGLWLLSFLFFSGAIRTASSIARIFSHMAAWMGKCEVSCLHSTFVSCTALSFLVILHKPVCHVRPTLFRRAASAWCHQGIKYLYECCKVIFFSFGRATQTCWRRYFWVDHGPGQRRIDAFGQTDRRTDALPEHGTIRFPQGINSCPPRCSCCCCWGHKNGRLVCLPTDPRACLLVCLTSPGITALRHRRLELLINVLIPGANSGGRATLSRKVAVASQASIFEVASGFHSGQCSPNLPPKV